MSPLDMWTDPAGMTELLASWTEIMADGPQAGRSDSPSPPPLATVINMKFYTECFNEMQIIILLLFLSKPPCKLSY